MQTPTAPPVVQAHPASGAVQGLSGGLQEGLPWNLLLAATLGSMVLMGILWVLARRQRDAGLVDVGWAGSLAAMALLYAALGPGDPLQRTVLALTGGVWGLRLTWHLLTDRVIGKPEDGRYAALREHWGPRADAHFIWFFQTQALLAGLLSVPFLMLASGSFERMPLVQMAGLALFVVSLVGETVADRQLAAFRKDARNKGTTCRRGLWRFSRHPNYFFEWLVWCAFALLALPTPAGAWALLAPLLMYVLVTRVSGIPYTELQALRSRGEDYRRYQRTTNAFFPWYPSKRTTQERAAVSADVPGGLPHRNSIP